MADNKTIINNSGNTGVDIPTATDEIGGVNYQRVKISVGDDGTAADCGPSNPLPISGALSVTGTMPVSLTAAATGGATPYSLISAATTNATNVKATAGTLYGYYLYNAAAYAVFLKLYDAASAPTAGSGTPVRRIGIPAGSAANLHAGPGLAFANGIGFTITKLMADADTTAVAASDLIVNLDYK